MTTTETDKHDHMFPFEKPGVFGRTGPCECGLTREQALAGDRIREQGQAAQSAFYAHFGTDANNGVEEIDEQHRPAWEAAARAVAGPVERERNILRGQLECAELTITDYRNALTALRAEFDRTCALLSEARSDRNHLRGELTGIALGTAGDPSVAADKALTVSRERFESVSCMTPDAKAAIEDAARDFNFRPGVAASILAAFPPPVQGEEIPLAAIFDGTHPRYLECDGLRAMYDGHPAVKSVIDAAVGIEGRKAVAS